MAASALLVVALSGSPGTAQAEIPPVYPTPTPPSMSAGLVSTNYVPPYVPGQTSIGPPVNRPSQQATQINVCTLGAEFHHFGDETLPLPNFTLDLPRGDYMVGIITRGSASSIEVCYRADASVLRLHDVSGGELGRTALSGDANWAFDAIVASVRPPFNSALGVRVPTLTAIAPY
jgi:hypothetical protein